MSSSGGSCSCGSSCNCGKGCGCGNYPTISETVTGLGPRVSMNSYGGVEMGLAAEDGGCKCGSNCTCDPCNC